MFEQPQNITPTPRKRILAADDDPILREMMMARLGNDIDVTCAENGEIAWEKLLAENFDLAIIDLGMPKLDGFGLIRYLRQTPKTVDLPIIVATSRGDAEAIEKAFASGASGFVTKPVNWSLFKHSVQFILKSGLTERQLRASKTENDLVTRSKDKLLSLMASQLQRTLVQNNTGLPNNGLADVIELSRLLFARPAVEFKRYDVNDIISRSVLHCQATAAEKSINLIGRQTLTSISINVDQPILTNALNRLVLFGIEASPDGGTVEVMPGGQPDGSLVVSVRDNGPGKSQTEIDAQLNVLVDDHAINNISQTPPDLNLPIVKKSAEIHGGRALFQNKTGEGNVSALWLPANRVQIVQLEQTA